MKGTAGHRPRERQRAQAIKPREVIIREDQIPAVLLQGDREVGVRFDAHNVTRQPLCRESLVHALRVG
jgi:hypothetical protein